MPMELVLLAAAFAFAYFMIIRPMRRQQSAQATMRSQLEPGSRVMLTSGLFGTIRHLGERQAIVELAPGLEVTVVKDAIAKVTAPDDEEFEFEDEADVDAAPGGGQLLASELSETPPLETPPLEPSSAHAVRREN